MRTSQPVTTDRSRPRLLTMQLGTDVETVIRWLVALLVMLIDPAAVVLTIAAARRRPDRSQCG